MNNKQQFINWVVVTFREAAWAPLSVICFYGVGLTFDWYALFPPLDIPSHLLGGAAITYFYRAAIKNSQNLVGEIPIPIQILLAFTCTGTTIILWEFYENALDFFLATQMVRGLEDTIIDMLVGLTGALVLSLYYQRR